MILILVAIYQTELTPYLPNTREELSTLLAQTIAEASASSSNLALEMDAEILKGDLKARVGKHTGLEPEIR
jgi:hypothetical protein